MPTHSFEASKANGGMVFVNKFAFGLHIPFVSGVVIEWKAPQVNDIIIIKTKKNKRLLKRVFGVASDVLLNEGVRFIVPHDFLFVGIDNRKISFKNNEFGLVNRKNNCGKVFFLE